MVKARKYVVIKYFEGNPKRSDFEIVEYDLPPLQDKQILVKVEWISVDPYMRPHKNRTYSLPYDQFGHQVGVVQESRNKSYPVGTRVVSHNGWCDYCIFNPKEVVTSPYHGIPHECAYILPDLKGLSASLGVGAVGFPGIAAYFGFLKLCIPKKGHTVVVTSAAGGVGSIVGQIAKIKRCRVIGFTGSDEKANWLKKELHFDYAFNYKTVDVTKVLKAVAPRGIDSFFDNVGGELSYAIMREMKDFGRVAICGCISYNDQSRSVVKSNEKLHPSVLQSIILTKQLRVEGFLAFRWIIMWDKAFTELTNWIRSGHLKAKEHVTEGFDNVVDALLGMLAGENCGKAVVKVL